MSLEDLAFKFKRYGATVKLHSANGSILISEYGGRIIGVSVNGSPNLLWTNPDLETVLENRGFNVGGLRVWVSPERNFFYKDPEVFGEWFCPSELDPGDFKVLNLTKSSTTLESKFKLKDLLNNEILNISILRDVMLEDLDDGGLAIHVRESLTASSFNKSRVGLWALAQVYPGRRNTGTVVVPVKRKAEPIHYFGPIPKDRLKVADSHVAFLIDGSYICKLGIKPEDLRVRGWASIGYFTEAPWSNEDALIITMETCCAPRSQAECLDVAKADPEGARAAVQSYNSGPNAEWLKFGEIELQFPASTLTNGLQFSTVSYTVKAYVGSLEKILDKFREVLKSPDVHILQ
jgi:hypothetical protein